MLLKIKKKIATIFYSFYDWAYIKRYKKYLKNRVHNKKLYIFDLDNTLAHTYPSVHLKNRDNVYKTLPTHKNMISIVLSLIEKNENCIVLTAREYKYSSATFFWLNKHLKLSKKDIYIVPTANDKLNYLKLAVQNSIQLTYYDDLSYNHENGTVKFYDSVISEVKNMPITYYGFEQINNINQTKNPNL